MKKRLDVALVERGLFETRAKAQAAVMAGKVAVAGVPSPKPGTPVADDAGLEIIADACPYVSRGGLKLESALKGLGVSPNGRVCLDLGASTGGFTDCLLQNGAAKVYAVDVGRGQLDQSLRSDSRVVAMEQRHARSLAGEKFDPRPDLAVVDVSFISLLSVLPFVVICLKKPFEILALVKPQFELGPGMAPKGVVRKPEHRALALAKIREGLPMGLVEAGILECPVHGPKGNIETFIHLKSAS